MGEGEAHEVADDDAWPHGEGAAEFEDEGGGEGAALLVDARRSGKTMRMMPLHLDLFLMRTASRKRVHSVREGRFSADGLGDMLFCMMQCVKTVVLLGY